MFISAYVSAESMEARNVHWISGGEVTGSFKSLDVGAGIQTRIL